ncbi:MAG TPA: methyltransferase [Gammaproteobacteria bacterium]|jgi:methylase of polypeptide subunit release factors|nr:methyltransferase [Gammaproteobacteria bacterium]HJP39529.1 methyltransferase [Gammaproteobacteria bacterium]
MIYPEFNNLKVENRLGVSPVGEDTRMIARRVAELSFDHALEVGTGTGFVILYLASLGRACEGTDISSDAVDCCLTNAAANGLEVRFYLSDLFENVAGLFDLIVFNPPYGHSRSGRWDRPLAIIKSLLPKENRWFSALIYQMIRKERRHLICYFLDAAREHLSEGGSVIIVLRHNELDLLSGETHEVIDELNQQRLVRWQPGSKDKR